MEIDDFTKVFAVGVLLFAVAIAVLGTAPIGGPGTETGDFRKEHTLFDGRIGPVGVVTETSRHIPLGDFDVGYTLIDRTIRQKDNTTIQNGWFATNSEEVTFSGDSAKKASLLFDVDDTNKYGDLIIRFNGVTQYANVTPKGERRFDFYDVRGTNTISIEASSSGPKFWAPTTYILKNMKVVVEEYGIQQKIVPFEVYNYEASGWSRGEVSFYVDDAIKNNPLFVELNDKSVYEDKPISRERVYEAPFTKLDASIRAGENVIRFSSGKDSKYSVKNAEISLFFYASGEAVSKTRTFDVDRYYIYLMEQSSNITGRITFVIEQAPVDNGLTVRLNDRKYEIESVGANETITLVFGKDDIYEGKNTLSFSTWGSYTLGDAKVEILDGREK